MKFGGFHEIRQISCMKFGRFHEIWRISWQGLIYTAYLACNRLIHVYVTIENCHVSKE